MNISPSYKEFLRLSKEGNVIPVYKEINADMDTPVSAFLKISNGDFGFLFESVEGQEKIARYSFLGSNPALVFESKGRNIRIASTKTKQVRRFITKISPLEELKNLMKDFQAVRVKGLPRFWGGFVGYIGYDMVRFFEKIPDKNPDDLKLPDAVFILTDTILIFDHVNHNIKIVANVILPKNKRFTPLDKETYLTEFTISGKKKAYSDALKKIDSIIGDFTKKITVSSVKPKVKGRQKLESNYNKKGFSDLVVKAKKYIKKGDIIQVVLSQRFKIKINREPFDIYRSLRSLNPSPYMFFLKLKETILIGSSPEMLVRCEDGVVQTRPIAGTRPRGKTPQEDQKMEKELLKDIKEKAEHIMLVDLGRNDLGRVCKPGEVEVSEFMAVERYSHVMHLVSEVSGVSSPQYDAFDILKAAFPAGTVSGSPKIRAMEIIDELENIRRGAYAGCVGYFSFTHNMDTCITIRTIVLKGNTAYIQAGAGIVADSVPEKEYFETLNKAKALLEVVHQMKT